MLEFLQSGRALSVFAVIGAIGIIGKLITRNLYKRLLKETENMAMTKNKNLKVLKQKLENAYRLNQNIVNTQAYLDKLVYGFKFMHVSLNGWNNLSLQMTILLLLAGGSASFMSYWYRLDSYYIILYASAGALGGLFITFLDSSFNIPLKQQRLSNSLLEYVDNSVFVRAARETTARVPAAATRMGTGSSKNQDMPIKDGGTESEITERENEIRNGLVRTGEPRGLSARTAKTRNVKADELLQTVRSLQSSASSEAGEEKTQEPRSSRAEGRNGASRREKTSDSEVRQDIDYLKRSLDQIAASKEKKRVDDDWAKNLDADELKVIGEIMRQYFSGN